MRIPLIMAEPYFWRTTLSCRIVLHHLSSCDCPFPDVSVYFVNFQLRMVQVQPMQLVIAQLLPTLLQQAAVLPTHVHPKLWRKQPQPDQLFHLTLHAAL